MVAVIVTLTLLGQLQEQKRINFFETCIRHVKGGRPGLTGRGADCHSPASCALASEISAWVKSLRLISL